MVIDMTAQLAPILWGMVGLLLVLGGAIAASIDTEVAEVYLGNRRLMVAAATVLVVVLAALVVIHPDIPGQR